MKFSPRKAVLAGVTALALSTTALTAAPAIAEENQQKNSIPSSSELFEKPGSSEGNGKESSEGDEKESTATPKPADSEKKDDNSQKQAGDKKEGSSQENKGSSEGGFNFKQFSEILKAISGVVGVASTIFAFLKSLKII